MAIITHKCNCYYRSTYLYVGLLSVWSPVQKFRVARQYYFRETRQYYFNRHCNILINNLLCACGHPVYTL